TVECDTDADGMLTVRENAWTGWTVLRDGERAGLQVGPWLAAYAPRGNHRYAFRYRPWDVPLGLGLTGVGLVAALVFWFRRPKRSSG
ncbi:MAG: hypothetical protein V1772_05965, partial [Chloroflexota bacterium]